MMYSLKLVLQCSTSVKAEIYLNWQASEASETLSGVTQLKIGDVCYIYVGTYVCHLYFDLCMFLC